MGNSDSVYIYGDRVLLLCAAVSSLTLERSDRDHCVLALNGTVQKLSVVKLVLKALRTVCFGHSFHSSVVL